MILFMDSGTTPNSTTERKMKKITGLLLLAALLIGAGSVYFFLQAPDTPVDTGYAGCLPPDTLATISLRDINGLTDIFPQTALGRFLSKETMGRILTDMQVDAKFVHDYAEEYDQLFSIVHNPAFRMVFGDDVDLALLPVDRTAFNKDPQQILEQSLIILATTSSSKTLETFARTFLHGDVKKVQHGDLELTKIRLDDDEFLYAFTQGRRLLLAFDPLAIERCVRAEASGITLLQEENYLAAVEFRQNSSIDKVHAMGFVQLDRIQPYLLASDNEDVKKMGRYLRGVKFFTSIGGQIENGWKVESTSSYTYNTLDPAIKELVDSAVKNTKNATLHLLEEKMLAYSWSSSLGARAMLEALSAGDSEKYKKLDQELQQELGFSLDQVIKAFGPQYGMVLKEIVQAGIFPLPKVVLFLQVKDHQIAEALLAKIRQKVAERGIMGAQQEQAGAYTIYSWAMLPGEATQPAVVLTEDMVYVANGPSSLQHVLSADAAGGKVPAVVAKALGSELSGQIVAADNGALILWPSRFAFQVKGAADWLAGMVEASRGGSVTVLKDELLLLMQSAEVVVFVSDLFPDYAVATATLKEKQEKESVR
jgi:hypothetical protein